MGLFRWLFRKMCNRIFASVDRDKSGSIEAIEVEVAIYQLYNIINKRLPGWQDPPTRKAIQEALTAYDSDKNGSLNKDEFVLFAGSLVKEGPDMFFRRVGKEAFLQTAVVPMLTRGVQEGSTALGWNRPAQVPLHVAAPVVGVLFKAIKAILPIGL